MYPLHGARPGGIAIHPTDFNCEKDIFFLETHHAWGWQHAAPAFQKVDLSMWEMLVELNRVLLGYLLA
jgi:hypothetical protein